MKTQQSRYARVVTMSFFFISGFTYAMWGVNIPLIDKKFHLSTFELTLMLFAVAMGAIVTLFFIGALIHKFGSKLTCQWSATLLAFTIPWVMKIANYHALLLILALFGALNAAFDTAMNIQVANIEDTLKKYLFSAMHGMFSVGGTVGAMVGSVCIAHTFTSEKSWILTSIFILLISLTGSRYLLSDRLISQTSRDISISQSKLMLMPIIGALAFLGLVVEGAMYDWTSLFMRDVVNADTVWIGVGYASFCIGMMIGRFSGDAIRKYLGDATFLQISGVIACSGFGVVLCSTAVYFIVLGFLLIGLGNANFVPILFAAGARNHIGSTAKGIAYVSRIGYFGFLLGPVIIGFFTTQFNLQVAFLFVSLCCVVIAMCANSVRQVEQ